ncbi:hypothetical protein CLF_108021 [Clonorchis sinensis]|uniref:Uncharacterized protein n=1 Tax=Clonorchis sinensis TaxID=79923 RepID=G7YHI9_CLOSI|nr:hypothetical protein CLF_108021 [Clonorchis sinensis]
MHCETFRWRTPASSCSYFASSRNHVTSQCRLLSADIDGPQQMWAKWLSVEPCRRNRRRIRTAVSTKPPQVPRLPTVAMLGRRRASRGRSANTTQSYRRFLPQQTTELLSSTGSDVRRQAAKPTDKSNTCVDLDIGECCENRTTTAAAKLPISSSTPSKVASLIVDKVFAQDPDSQSLKPDHSEPESPSYTQLATLIAGDSGVLTSAKERRLQPNKLHPPDTARANNRPSWIWSSPTKDISLIRNPEPQTWIRNFCRADFSGMRIFLNQVKLGPASVEDLYRTIVQKVHEADAMYVPKKPARSRTSRKLPKRIRRLLEKRSQLFLKKLTTGDTEDELAFRKMRNRCKSEIRQWNIRKQATILDLARKNRNVLFKYMRHRRRNKPSAFSLRDRNGEPTSDPIVVSEFYRDHYAGDLILTYALFEQGLANRFLTVDPANTRRGHGERQLLNDKNKTDPGNLGESLDPVQQSVDP